MIVVNELNLGWTGQPSRRARQPAAPKPFNPRKTVKPTPRGKYGLGPRRERFEQVGEEEGQDDSLQLNSSARPATPYYTQLYQQLVSGSWPGAKGHQHQRKPLFNAAVSSPDVTPTPELLRKILPGINNTNYWPRLQRKILPKYLFVLNDTAAVALLRTLSRLQPPVVAPAPSETAKAARSDDSGSNALVKAATSVHDPQQEPVSRPSSYAASSSITGAFKRRHQSQSTTAAASTGQQLPDLTVLDAAAVARGFHNAADEREQFDLMLSAVYTVFQQKLRYWDGKRLMKLVGCFARLQLAHQGFIEAWFAATASLLHQQQAAYLVVCLEALASLHVSPPQHWLDSWIAASQDRLQELSLQQLAMLLLHVGELQLRLPDLWWQSFMSCVIHQTEVKQQATRPAADPGRGAADEQQLQSVEASSLSSPAATGLLAQQQQQEYLTRPAADALCSILWSLRFVHGQPVDDAWLASCLDQLLPAVQHRRCSAGAAVQLLHACTLSVCKQLQHAVQAREACLVLVQQRASKVCGSSALPLLLDCLSALGSRLQQPIQEPTAAETQQQLPEGFCEDLEDALTPVLPILSADLLIRVAQVLAALQRQPGIQLLSAFVLATSNKMDSISCRDVAVLVDCCASWGVVMPNVWLASVIQHLASMAKQHVALPPHDRQLAGHEGASRQLSTADASGVAHVLGALPKLSANWESVCAAQRDAVSVLSACVAD